MSVLEDLSGGPPATPLADAARHGSGQFLQRTFAAAPIYVPRTDDNTAFREVIRGGQRWVPVYDTHAGLLAVEAASPEAGVEHSQTTGRSLRARLPEDVGVLLRLDRDEEYLVAYPALAPVQRVDLL